MQHGSQQCVQGIETPPLVNGGETRACNLCLRFSVSFA